MAYKREALVFESVCVEGILTSLCWKLENVPASAVLAILIFENFVEIMIEN